MAISIGAVLIVLLVGGQFVAPVIATSVLRGRLAAHGKVLSVHLSAFPWFQLLWQNADRVTARMADYTVEPGELATRLHEAAEVGTLDMTIGVLHTGPLTLHDVSFMKHGDEMRGVAQLELRDLQSALPIIRSVRPVRESSGQLVLRGTASVFGVSASVDAVVAARSGRLVVAPTGLLGAFATITLFDDPQIHVQSVTATTVPDGLRFVATGELR